MQTMVTEGLSAYASEGPPQAWAEIIPPKRQPPLPTTTTTAAAAALPDPPAVVAKRLSRDFLSEVILLLGDIKEKPYNKSRAIREVRRTNHGSVP